MPISFRYFRCGDLPELELDQEISSVTQLAIPTWDPEAHSTLHYLGLSTHHDFERYECIHQSEREVDALYREQEIRVLLFNLRFTAYYNRLAQYFLLQAGKRESRDFFLRLQTASPAIHAKAGKLNLALIQNLGDTTGGWFGNLKIENVSSAGIFGTDEIVGSNEWARYSNVGEISALNMRLASRSGITRSVQVTRDRLVLLMQGTDERDNLDFVAHLNELFDSVQGPDVSEEEA
jgi:hypothetical protein